MRKTDSAKGKLVCEIKNGTIVEVDEAGEEWCHVLYNGKDGYIMTEYLHLASMWNGKGPKVTLTPETVHVGETVTVTVTDDTAVQYVYSLVQGKKKYGGKTTASSTSAFRPKETGICCLTVTSLDRNGQTGTNEVFFNVTEALTDAVPAENSEKAEAFTVYSQKDGWWSDKRYGSSNLEDSGCAIFTLAHGLQLLKYTGEKILPQNLAREYGFCLVDGGTLNSTLIGRTARDFSYSTQEELIKDKGKIRARFQNGAVFTFAIVKGHIALAAGLSEDGEKILIVDSAPSVTLERISGGKLYLPDEKGTWTQITDLAQVPGATYYFETDQYGGLTYYLDLSYVAKRGVRLIQPR